MPDAMSPSLPAGPPSWLRPLFGLTVLVIEDSRFASEALRLMCVRSGARIRRADCLRAARRHLQTYRPAVLIVDIGLPDGSGTELIAEAKALAVPVPAVLGLSGDPARAAEALRAGADAFLPKPVESLALFQQAMLSVLPSEVRGTVTPQGGEDTVIPDPLALRDDLSHAAEVLAARGDAAATDYAAQFVAGLARACHDEDLETAAEAAAGRRPTPAAVSQLCGLVQARLDGAAVF
ncbi:response regulator [Sinirhodobacter ferrireducens]|uniref:Response regulator n=2 Tax=Paenirhodobacter ferrireducens TaxID=1215032 RepID=A0A443LAT7_9RHOB|nr:response regulator [Sinirhodobacter ferrireducens]